MARTGTESCPVVGLVLAILNIRAVLSENWLIVEVIRKITVEHNCSNCILIRSKKMQQYAGIYLLQNYSTRFGCPSRPSSGVHKTVTAASGTGHIM